MTERKYSSEEIKERLSNIGEAIGKIALAYIIDLEQQVDKLKCCENCKHHYWAGGADLCCRLRENECKDKIKLEKWEFES